MDNRAIVKQFISERWSDQKIAEVFAFNQDGKMYFVDRCHCLLGMDLCGMPGDFVSTDAYLAAQGQFRNVELAYLLIWEGDGHVGEELDPRRQVIIEAILTEIMAEREALRVELSPADVAAIQEVTHG